MNVNFPGFDPYPPRPDKPLEDMTMAEIISRIERLTEELARRSSQHPFKTTQQSCKQE